MMHLVGYGDQSSSIQGPPAVHSRGAGGPGPQRSCCPGGSTGGVTQGGFNPKCWISMGFTNRNPLFSVQKSVWFPVVAPSRYGGAVLGPILLGRFMKIRLLRWKRYRLASRAHFYFKSTELISLILNCSVQLSRLCINMCIYIYIYTCVFESHPEWHEFKWQFP